VSRRVGKEVEVRWRDHVTGKEKSSIITVGKRPFGSYVWSLVWFAQEMVIFVVGALVYAKRPHDESARLFFWLCVVTVGAYMGGYHWTEIVVVPWLIYPFAAFAVFVPVVSLHFYLVFPRRHRFFEAHRRLVLGALYGIPLIYLSALWGAMYGSRWLGRNGRVEAATAVLATLQTLALSYIGLSVFVFSLCILCLIASYRSAPSRAERNQVQWI